MKEKVTEQNQELTLTILSNKIKSIYTKNSTRTACRIYKDGKIGISGCIGETDINELYKKAEQNLEYQIDYPVEPTKNLESHIKIDSCKISNREFYGKIENILKELSRLHPDYIVSNKVYLRQSDYSIKNELGMDLSYSDKHILSSLFMKEKKSSEDNNAYFLAFLRDLETERILEAITELMTAHSKPLTFPKEPLPLVLDDYLVTQIFNTELRADVLGTGSSLFQHQLGKEIFSKNFSLKINNNPLESFRSNFDMEGVITPENLSCLIKDGVIIRPFSDKRTSKLYGYENTGCGCGDYDSVPTLGRADIEIQPGEKTIKELLNGQIGILVYWASGGDFTPDGNFATSVQLSYLTDGKKLLGRLPKFIIKGSVYDIFGKNFIGMSKDKLFLRCNHSMFVTRMDITPL